METAQPTAVHHPVVGGGRTDHDRRRERATDCGFLILVLLLSATFWLGRLGFYSDDWAFLKSFKLAPDQSWSSLFQTFSRTNGTWSRPVQVVWYMVLYKLFDDNPLGYHITIALVLAIGVCLLYLCLERLLDNRLIALVVALCFGFVPHYSTDRLWFATSQVGVSMVFFFLSLYAELRLLRPSPRRGWGMLSAGSTILSGLSYEAFLPLFFLNPVLVGLKQHALARQAVIDTPRWLTHAWRFLRAGVLVTAVLTFKFLTTTRAGMQPPTVSGIVDAATQLVFIDYWVRLPRIVEAIWLRYSDLSAVLMAGLVTVMIGIYLMRVATRPMVADLPSKTFLIVALLAAFIVTGLSYSQFWVYFRTSVGINNRVAIAASVPASCALVALMCLLAQVVRHRVGARLVLSAMCALCCGYFYLVDATIARWWIQASDRQHVILRELKTHLPTVPPGSSILLSGYCPWIGPGIIFETSWDVAGVLALSYGDRSVQGDVLTPRLEMAEEAAINAEARAKYPYTSLFIYDVGAQQVVQIADQPTAVHYQQMAAQDPRNACMAHTDFFNVGQQVW